MAMTLSPTRAVIRVVHAYFQFESMWHATTDEPMSAHATGKTYRRTRGQLKRALESALGAPVRLVEHIRFPASIETRIQAFRAMREEQARLDIVIPVEARRLAQELSPQLAMTTIARELGITNAELQYLVHRSRGRSHARGADESATTTPPRITLGEAHAHPASCAQP